MFQYSLRTLLLVMLAASVLAWAVFVLDNPWSGLVFDGLFTITSGVIVAGIVYFRGYQQAFCIAAAPAQFLNTFGSLGSVWRMPLWLSLSSDTDPFAQPDWKMQIGFLSALTFVILSGLSGMFIRAVALHAVKRDKDDQTIAPGHPPH